MRRCRKASIPAKAHQSRDTDLCVRRPVDYEQSSRSSPGSQFWHKSIRRRQGTDRRIDRTGESQRAIQTAPFPLQHKVTVLRLWVLVSAFAFMIEALGAQQIPTGKMHAKKNKSFATTELAGRVVAPAGVPVAGVIVSLENLATHHRREAESTLEGTFQLQQIFAGEYKLTATAAGYKTFIVPQMPLVAGDQATANIVMER